MLKIGEFAALSSISINMLRNYDKIGLLCPKHVDKFSGYRYYDKCQLVDANRIVALKELGFTLEEIESSHKLEREKLDALLDEKKKQAQQEILQLQKRIDRIQTTINAGDSEQKYALNVAIKTMPKMLAASYIGIIHEYSHEGMLWGRLNEICTEKGIGIEEHSIGMAINHGHTDSDGKGREKFDNDIDGGGMSVEVLLSVKYSPKAEKMADEADYSHSNNAKLKDEFFCIRRLTERQVASVAFKGSYNQIGQVNSFVADWLEQNHYHIVDEVFSIYHNSPGNKADEAEYITEICFPIEKNKIFQKAY